jgi:hypothetical protein
MNTDREGRSEPRATPLKRRPPSVVTGRPGTPRGSSLPAPPRDRLPPRPAIEVSPRETVPTEVVDERRAGTPPRRPAGDLRPGDRPTRSEPSNRELLRRALSSPRAIRQAILLREVLGPPVSLRTDIHDRPS